MAQPGDLFAGRYLLGDRLGRGGMGEVYLATDQSSGGSVALKVLRDDAKEDDARFVREARTLAALKHPGIVRYLDDGVGESGERYLAMEWIEGLDLDRKLAQGPLSIDETLQLAAKVLDALGAAHRAGVVHRDLKPSNIYLANGRLDSPRLLDFGIARLMSGQPMTRTGALIGTPGYMAPEQARGVKGIDARTDLYSLGCVLYECLTAEPAFQAENVMALLAKVLLEEPPRLSARVTVPAALDALVQALMAKSPDARPASAAAALELLASAPSGGAMSLRPMGDREQRLVCAIAVATPGPGDGDTGDGSTVKSGGARSLTELTRVCQSHGAVAEALADGSLIAVLTAAGAATDLVGRAAELALTLKRRAPDAPVALATGRALVEGGRVPLGEAVERACRSALSGGEQKGVGLDELSQALLGPRFVVDAPRRRLLALATAAEDGARPLLGKQTPFVGRDRELTGLLAAYAQAVEDARPAVVLVTAPAGFGKSRLRLELHQRLTQQPSPPVPVFARCEPMRAESPLGLARSLLLSLLSLDERSDEQAQRLQLERAVELRVPGPDANRVAAFAGEVLGLPYPAEATPLLAGARRDPSQLTEQVRRAFEELLAAESKKGPVVVLIEDLHWADATSVKLLDAMLGRLRDQPLLLCCFARPEVTTRFGQLWEERGLQLIRLPELAPRACEKLVRQVLGERADSGEVARLVSRSSGNAFYLEELIRAAAEGGSQELPQTVVAMAQARLEALAPDDRRLLRAAAVLGEHFWEAGVSALTSMSNAGEQLSRLVEREVLMVRAKSSLRAQRELAFRHAYLRDAAYAMLPENDRAHAHLLAAQWLESAGETDPRTLAGHYEKGGDRAHAAKWYLEAAEQALQRGDWAGTREAARLGRLQQQAELGAALAAVDLEALRWASEYLVIAREADAAFTLAAPGSRQWLRIASSAAIGYGVIHDNARSLELASELIGVTVAEEDLPLYCVAAARLAIQLYINDQIAPARALQAKVESVAGPLIASAPYMLGWVEELRGFSFMRANDPLATLAAWERARTAFGEAGDLRNERAQRSNSCYIMSSLYMSEAVEQAAQQLIAEGRNAHLPGLTGAALTNLTWIRLVDNHPDRLQTAREALETCRSLDDGRHPAQAYSLLAVALLEAGDLAAAEQLALQGYEIAQKTNFLIDVRPALALVRIAQGRFREAVEVIGQPRSSLMATPLLFNGLGSLTVKAQALKQLGDRPATRAALVEALELARRWLGNVDDATRARWRSKMPMAQLFQMAQAEGLA